MGTSRRYEETITALHISTRELMSAESVDEVLQRTADAASDVLGFPGTAVRRHETETGLLHHVAFGGRVGDIDSRPSFRVDESPHGRAVRRGETVIDNIEQDDPYGRDTFTQTTYTPIGETGLLSVGAVGSTFDETDVQFAEILAENAAVALQLVETAARLREERERLDRFASVVSHDLRNPLGIATLALERARETHEQEDFDRVASGLQRMERMVDDGGFYVADDRQGIPEANRGTVLEHGVSGKGTPGLGLSIVRDIVDAHGWELTVTESRDGGARFEIRTGS